MKVDFLNNKSLIFNCCLKLLFKIIKLYYLNIIFNFSTIYLSQKTLENSKKTIFLHGITFY